MVPVKTSTDIQQSQDIHRFRQIRHSTQSKRLFQNGVQVKLPQTPKLQHLTMKGFHIPGGQLEAKLTGQAVDQAMNDMLTSLRGGSLLYNLLATLLLGLYRRLRTNIIEFIIKLFYKVVVTTLKTIYRFLISLVIVPLSFITFLLLILTIFSW